MHISPALVCWAWRWYPDPTKVKFDSMSAEQLKAYNTASWWDIGVLSMSTYMIWVVLYYIKVLHPLVVMFVSPGHHPLIGFAKHNSQSCSLFCNMRSKLFVTCTALYTSDRNVCPSFSCYS